MKTLYASLIISLCAAMKTSAPGKFSPIIHPRTLQNGHGRSINTWHNPSSGVSSLTNVALKRAVKKLFQLHNQERVKNGCSVKFTCFSKKLSLFAVNASFTQIRKQKSGNYDGDQRCIAAPGALTCAENVAGGRPIVDPMAIMSNWMHTPDTRREIIGSVPITRKSENKRDTIGIGIAQDPKTKKYWITALMTRRKPGVPCDPLPLNSA
jgi:hypothetical protein